MLKIHGHRVIEQDVDKNDQPHGGMVRIKGPYPKSEAEAQQVAALFTGSIERGIALLESGSSPYAADCPPVDSAAVETFDYFDPETGEHVMVWRIACRPRVH